MLSDPIDYATRRSGPLVTGLRLSDVADDLADDMRDRCESVAPIQRDSRARVWLHTQGKPSIRMSPAAVGTRLRGRFLELTQLKISGEAASPKAWRMIAEMICEIFRAETPAGIDAWVQAHIVHSAGDFLRSENLLDLLLAQNPGPRSVRGRELAFALVESGFCSDERTRRRIDGAQHKTYENIKYIE